MICEEKSETSYYRVDRCLQGVVYHDLESIHQANC